MTRDHTAKLDNGHATELRIDQLDQVTGGNDPKAPAGPAPAAAVAVTAAAAVVIGAVAGVVLGHVIKGDEE